MTLNNPVIIRIILNWFYLMVKKTSSECPAFILVVTYFQKQNVTAKFVQRWKEFTLWSTSVCFITGGKYHMNHLWVWFLKSSSIYEGQSYTTENKEFYWMEHSVMWFENINMKFIFTYRCVWQKWQLYSIGIKYYAVLCLHQHYKWKWVPSFCLCGTIIKHIRY